MDMNWTKADFKNCGKKLDSWSELRSAHEALARDFGISLSAFLGASIAASYKGCEELPCADLTKTPARAAFGLALVRPDDRKIVVELEYPLLFPLIGVALGAKPSSFTLPDRKPTEIELQVVNVLCRLILTEAYRVWASLVKAPLETVALEVEQAPFRSFQPSDTLFVARFELTVGEHSGRLALIVPPSLFVFEAIEEASKPEKPTVSGSIDTVLDLMLPAKVSVDVWLDGAQMRLRDLLQLREGQVVKLDHPVERKAVCTLNGKGRVSGQIVSTGAKRAFLVEETPAVQS